MSACLSLKNLGFSRGQTHFLLGKYCCSHFKVVQMRRLAILLYTQSSNSLLWGCFCSPFFASCSLSVPQTELRVWGLITYIRLKQAAGLVFTPSVTHLPERTTNCCCCPLQALSSDSFSAEVCFTTSFITCRPSSDAVVWCFRVNNTSYLC